MDDADDKPIRFSVLNLLGITTYIAAILGLVSYTNSVAVGVHLTFVLLGWILWKYGNGHLGGIIPTLLGADFLLAASVSWVYYASEDFMGFRMIACFFSSLLSLGGLGVFLWIASKRGQYWKNQVVISAFLFVWLIVYWISIPAIGNAAIAKRRSADIASNNVAIAKVIPMVEAVVLRYGKTPDPETLAELLDEPLPTIRWDGFSQTIRYAKTSASSYQLSYIEAGAFMGDIIVYDSTTPTKGWYRVPW